jgi:tight adherence protein B
VLIALALLAIAAGALALVAVVKLRAAGAWWAGLAGQRTEAELASLFVFIPARRLLAVTLVSATMVAAVSMLCRAPLPLTLVLAVLALALPRLASRWLRARWRRPLSLWAGLLRAGQGTSHALAQVAGRQPAPLGQELRFILGQVRMGVPVEAGFAALRERAGLADLRLLSTLLATHRDLGGNLAESLQRLAELLRSRLLMEARIDSLTSQGRMQGVVVGLLPLLLLAVLYVMEREAMQVLHTTWQGWAALALIAALEVAGFAMIRRIVRIDV